MDASFTFLPVSASEYLHWLKEAHSSTDNWQRFERALGALHAYSVARTKANTRKTRGAGFSSDFAGTTIASQGPSSSESRRGLFIALAGQIVAQEELRIAIESCREQCEEENLSSDAERFLAWLQARYFEAETEVLMVNLLRIHELPEPAVS